MGVAAHQLLTDRVRHVAEGEVTGLIGDFGLHQHLEQDVAQLFAEFGHRLLIDRLQDLIGFLEHRGPQRRMRLLAVPGTPLRRAQTPHHAQQLPDALDVVSHVSRRRHDRRWLRSPPATRVRGDRAPRPGRSPA